MVRPSNPKLMAKVLSAVSHLGESKGSSIRDILQIVKKGSNGPNRNLTMQVQRALKHAVTAGILRHRNGRYKNAIALAQISQLPKRRDEDNYKVVNDMPDVDESPNAGVDPLGSIQDRRRRGKRRGSRRRRGSRKRRKGSRRRGRRRSGNEEYQNMAPERRKPSAKPKIREEDRIQKRSSDKYSEISGSEHESRHRSRKSKPETGSRRSSSRPDQRKEICDNTNRRSQSRHRSQTRSQPPIEDSDNHNAMDCDDDGNEMDNHGQDVDNCDTKNCGSESSL